MALVIQREIIKEIQGADFFSIMADETADISNMEQLVNCIRWVNNDLEVNEEFIGLHPLEATDAGTIFKVLKVLRYYVSYVIHLRIKLKLIKSLVLQKK